MTGAAGMQILMGALGSLGFSLLFNARGKTLLFAALGGGIGWSVYLLFGGTPPDDLKNYLFAAMAITLYAEILARVLKTPVTTILVASVIPLIPGGSLYYTMAACIRRDFGEFSSRGAYTLSIAAMLALGIMAVMMLARSWASARARYTHRRVGRR